jgi:hypothetical protein
MSMGGFIFRGVVLSALAMSPAFADSSKKPTPAPAEVTVNQPVAIAGAAAGSKSEADAKAAALAASNAEGGDAKAASLATGGKAVAKGGDATGGNSDASSNSGGNSLTVNERHVRQAPGLAQGSFAIVGCGVAANAGASNVGGAGFLGFGFTPSQCYDFMLANAYCTAGATEACCEVLNNSKAGRRASKRGVRLPECRHPEPPAPEPCCQQAPQPPPIVVVPQQCCDKPECDDNRCYEKCDKACKAQCQGNAECEQRCERLCKRRCDGEPPGPAGTGGASCPNPTGK